MPGMFLSSMAIAPDQLGDFESLVGKPAAQTTLVLCENAADPEGQDERPAWVQEFRQGFASLGFRVRLLDLRQPLVPGDLADADAVWFGGGNVYYLRWIVRQSGMEALLADLVAQGVVIGGGSAGAVIMGPTLRHFDAADDPTEAPEVIWEGVALTDHVVVPHLDNPDYGDILQQANQRLLADGHLTIGLTDSQAAIITGGQVGVVG